GIGRRLAVLLLLGLVLFLFVPLLGVFLRFVLLRFVLLLFVLLRRIVLLLRLGLLLLRVLLGIAVGLLGLLLLEFLDALLERGDVGERTLGVALQCRRRLAGRRGDEMARRLLRALERLAQQRQRIRRRRVVTGRGRR